MLHKVFNNGEKNKREKKIYLQNDKLKYMEEGIVNISFKKKEGKEE